MDDFNDDLYMSDDESYSCSDEDDTAVDIDSYMDSCIM